MSSPSDSNAPDNRWLRHYEEAARRRRARGWHRRDEGRGAAPYERDATRKRQLRFRLYVAAGAVFVAVTLAAMFLPR